MTVREFQFTEGSSNKFWKITLNDTRFTVHYGRVGTTGQMQEKDFATAEAARAASEKLVQEKLKKGYVETGAQSVSQAAAATSTANVTSISSSAVAAKKTEQPATLPASKPAPAAPAQPVSTEFEITNNLALESQDWYRATWRNLEPLPLPEAKPFDKDAALKSAAKAYKGYWNYASRWSQVNIPRAMTGEEATFWLYAMLRIDLTEQSPEIIKDLAKRSYEKTATLADIHQYLRERGGFVSQETLLPLLNLFTTGEITDLILTEFQATQQWYGQPQTWTPVELARGFAKYALPYLTHGQIEMLRQKVQQVYDPAKWPTITYHQPPAYFYLAAALGMHDEVRALVTSWPDNYITSQNYFDYYLKPQDMIFGLGSAAEVEQQMRRLKLRVHQPEFIRAWLAHTETRALDVVRDSIIDYSNKEEAKKLLETFALVNAPAAAPFMLELMQSSKAPQVARLWLEENPANTIAGLIPTAAGRGKLADAATAYLQTLRRKGCEPLIEKCLNTVSSEIAARVREAVLNDATNHHPLFDEQTTPEWLQSAITSGNLKAKARSAFVTAADLPAIVIENHCLNPAQTETLLAALRASTLTEIHPLVSTIKPHAEKTSLDQFAWRLFELWLGDGGAAKEKWAMMATGLLGGDGCVLKLTPLIREWPGESQHQRAVLGLECLRTIGTDTALMQINGIAQKLKFKGLKEKAGACMVAIADERSLSRAQLEDRIVPDCDLDERGSRQFDFGARQFRFALGSGLKPMLRDESGKLLTALPKPNAKDDAAKAEQASAEWKLLKKQLSEVVKTQTERLKQAMVTGRRWSVEEFETLLVNHPLMMNLARLLVWGGHDAQGKLVATFRLTEDQTYANSSDETATLTSLHDISLVHPMHMIEADRHAWGELFSDYEIIQPFPQLGRPIYQLEPGEAKAKMITRFKDIKIPAAALVFTLDGRGWTRGIPGDGGNIFEHTKQFPGAGVTAVICYDGVPVGYYDGWEDQKVEKCFFLNGLRKPDYWMDEKEALLLSSIDAVVISEVLRDLTLVTAKGK